MLETDTPSIGYDGGQIQFSVNGGAFQIIPAGSITGTTYNVTISTAFGSFMAGQQAFSGTSAGFSAPAYVTSSFTLGTNFNEGDSIVFRFLFASDVGINVNVGNNWQIGSLSFDNVAVPEPSALGLCGLSVMGIIATRRRRSIVRFKRIAIASAPSEVRSP
jgi:hypothetical protein